MRCATELALVGFAVLEKACLIDHQDRIVNRQLLDDVIVRDLAKRVPLAAP